MKKVGIVIIAKNKNKNENSKIYETKLFLNEKLSGIDNNIK